MENFPNPDSKKIYRRDSVFALLSLAAGYLFSELILFGGFGVAVPAFVLLFYALTLSYLSREKIHFNRSSILTYIIIAIISLFFILYDNEILRFFNVLALLALIPLNITYFSGSNEYGFFSAGSVWEILRGIFVYPLSNMDKGIAAVRLNGKQSSKTSQILKAIVGVLLISPAAVLILFLLTNSDAGFEHIMYGVTTFLRQKWSVYFYKVLFAILFSFPIFSFLFSVFYQNRNYSVKKYAIGEKIKVIDPTYTNSALWVICTIYILYIFSQLAYFFSAFRNTLPGGFTYAGYARRGFFQLVAVCVINLLLLVFAMAFSKRKNSVPLRSSKITIAAFSLLTILLIVTSFSKMAMYIGFFGLTPERLYASWFMLVLLVVFLLVIFKMIFDRFRIIQATALVFTVLYLGLNFANLDALIPQYNIAHENAKAGIDTAMFSELSDSMVPQAAVLLNNPRYKSKIEALLKERGKALDSLPYQQWSIPAQYAKAVIHQKLGE